MRYFLAILAIIISYIILSGIIVGAIFKGNVYGGGGLLTTFIMIPVAIFLWKTITKKREK
jgi:ABC-type transport system involved in cytochrome bd biosynthesis fused ATPase/permease subunit